MIIDAHGHVGRNIIPGHYKDSDCKTVYEKYGITKGVFSSMTALMGNMSEGNAEMYDFVQNNDFAYGFVFVTASQPDDSISEVKKYIKQEKIAGFKVHGNYSGASVDDKRLRPVWDMVNPYKMVVLVHCDHVDPMAHPYRIREVAELYPDTRFIIAHHACAAWEEACEVAKKYDNIYMDMVASWNEYDVIKKIVDRIGEDKLMFGSDIGLFDPGAFIGSILSSRIPQSVKEKIFYKNAQQLFGFDD